MQPPNQTQQITVKATDLASDRADVIHLLYVDDDPSILEISKQILMMKGKFEIGTVTSVDEAFKKLKTEHYDCIVSAYDMPQKNGLEFLKELKEQKNEIPFVLFTSKGREEIAIKALNLGADGYFNKQGSPETVYCELSHGVHQAVRGKKAEKKLAESELKYRSIFSNSEVGMFRTRLDGSEILDCNEKFLQIFGRTREEMKGQPSVIDWADPIERQEMVRILQQEGKVADFECKMLNKQNQIKICRTSLRLYPEEGILEGSIIDITEQKKAQEKILQSEEKYRSVFESSLDGILFSTVDGTLISANATAAKILGYNNVDDLLGAPVSSRYVNAVDRQIWLERLFNQGELKDYEFKLKKKDGSQIVCLSNSVVQRDSKEQIKWIQTVFRDITERKKTEQEIADLARFPSENPSPIMRIAKDNTILYANPAAKNLFRHWKVEVGDHSLPQMRRHIASVLKSGLRKNIEVKYRNRTFVFIFKPILSAGYVNVYALDITERKKAEELIKKSKEQLKAVISNAPIGIATSDSNKYFLSANEFFCKIIGFSEDELRKLTFKDITYAEDIEKSITNMQELISGRISFFSQEKRYVRKDGTIIDGKITVNAIRDKGGKPTIFVAELEDVTERKKAESEKQEKYEALEKVAESIDAGLAVISKDYDVYWANSVLRNLGVSSNKKCYQTFNHLNEACPDCGVKKIFEKNVLFDAHEYKYLNSKGEITWVELRVTPLKDKSGNVTAALELAVPITERKKTEAALKNSEEKFRNLAEQSPNMIFINQKGKVVYANKEAEKALGYTGEEFFSPDFNFMRLIAPESKESVNSKFIQHMKGVDIHPYEYRLVRKDGKTIDAINNVARIDYNGEPALLGVITDVTERKKAEQKLHDEEQCYHALFDQAPIGVLVVDPKTAGFVEFNDVAHNQLGYTRDEFAALNVPKIETKETVDIVKSHIAQMVIEGDGEFETQHRTKDGEIRNVLVSTRVVDLAGKTLLHCIFHDITEIRKVQDALMKSETQYRQLVELAQEGIWAFDKEFNSTFLNSRMTQIMGYAKSEMIGKNLFEFVDMKHVDQARKVLGEYQQGVQGEFEYEFTRKDGSRVYTSIAASPITDDQGNYVGTLALVADITLRKQMADKLAEYSKRLEELVEQKTKQLAEAQAQLLKSERLAAIGELAGMVGHDLRNPLSGIKNATYFLEKKSSLISEAQSKDMFRVINKCIDHSNKIINDLLDYSREIHLDLKESKPSKLISDALAMANVPEKVKIISNVPDKQHLKVDPGKIERVLINLVKNAVDAMPNGGTISIDSKERSGNVEISIADTGMGIPDDILSKLFSPLVTTKAQGMGFGLAICKRIIEAHGGTITVTSAKGEGATFKVSLPIEPKLEVTGEKDWIMMPESLALTATKP